MRICRHPLLALAVLLVLSGGRASAAPELKKVRILLVFDTTSDLNDQLVKDEKRIGRLLRANLPAARMEVRTLRGRDATREKILAYYRNLRTSDDEGLVFFYGGHGAMDPRKGHYLQLQNGKRGGELVRSELRKAMEDKKAGLVVILTDCCSNMRRVSKRQLNEETQEKVTARGKFHPTLRSLFFQARGTVDITAATGTVSWGDDASGGLFTRSLCKMLTTSPAALGAGKDGALSWKEFFPRLKRNTETTFRAWKEEMRKANGGRDEVGARTMQTPQAFALGKQGNNNAQTWAVVSLTNETTRPLRYSVRWSTQSSWEQKELAPGKRTCHALPLPRPDQEVSLLARLEVGGTVKPHTLKVSRYSGDGKPGFDDGWKYRWWTRPSRVARRDGKGGPGNALALDAGNEDDQTAQTVTSAKPR
jgi:hypothetical protein